MMEGVRAGDGDVVGRVNVAVAVELCAALPEDELEVVVEDPVDVAEVPEDDGVLLSPSCPPASPEALLVLTADGGGGVLNRDVETLGRGTLSVSEEIGVLDGGWGEAVTIVRGSRESTVGGPSPRGRTRGVAGFEEVVMDGMVSGRESRDVERETMSMCDFVFDSADALESNIKMDVLITR